MEHWRRLAPFLQSAPHLSDAVGLPTLARSRRLPNDSDGPGRQPQETLAEHSDLTHRPGSRRKTRKLGSALEESSHLFSKNALGSVFPSAWDGERTFIQVLFLSFLT